jgi:hypothetical protein
MAFLPAEAELVVAKACAVGAAPAVGPNHLGPRTQDRRRDVWTLELVDVGAGERSEVS